MLFFIDLMLFFIHSLIRELYYRGLLPGEDTVSIVADGEVSINKVVSISWWCVCGGKENFL